MQPYERFEAWQFAHKLNLATHRITVSWPVAERYGLTAQVRRCAFSVVANMVEGSAKRGRREFARFLDISIGSLAELSYAYRFAREVGYLAEEEANELEALRESTARLTHRLYQAVSGRGRRDP